MTDPRDRKKGGLRKAQPKEKAPVLAAKRELSAAEQIAEARMGGTYDKFLRNYYGLFRWGDQKWPDGELIEKLRQDGVLSEGQAYKDNISGVKKWLERKFIEHESVRRTEPLKKPLRQEPRRRL